MIGMHACLMILAWFAGDMIPKERQTLLILINPTDIKVGGKNTCAIDDTGVVCWGEKYDRYNLTVPVLSNPTRIEMGLVMRAPWDDTGTSMLA